MQSQVILYIHLFVRYLMLHKNFRDANTYQLSFQFIRWSGAKLVELMEPAQYSAYSGNEVEFWKN